MPDATDVPEYWEMDGQPVRRRHRLALLEILTPQGDWVTWSDPRAFWTRAVRVTEAEARRLAREWAGG